MNRIMSTSAALGLLVGATACDGGARPGNEAGTAVDAAPNAANVVAAQGNEAQAPASADAGEAEVRTFLDRVYAPYRSDAMSDTDFEGILAPELAAAVLNTEGGPGADPFIDAQDYSPFRPTYDNIQVRGDRASATVRFNNFGAPTRIDYELIRTPAGWRAYDVRSANGGSLRQRFLTTNQ